MSLDSEENQNPTGDQVEGNVGDDAGIVGVGKGITQQSAKTGDIYINLASLLADTKKPPTRSRSGRTLMPAVEQEFRKTFMELTQAIVELKGTVTVNNTLTAQNIAVLQKQLDNVKELVENTENKVISSLAGVNIVAQSPKPAIAPWVIYVGVTCVIVMTLATVAGAFFAAQGFSKIIGG